MSLPRITGAIALTVCVSALAQAPKRDPKVQAVLDQSIAAYKGLTAFHEKVHYKATATSAADMLPPDLPESIEVRYQKPNHLYLSSIVMSGGKPFRDVIACDGVTLLRWNSRTKLYMQEKAPSALTAVVPFHEKVGPEMDPLLLAAPELKEWPVPMALSVGKPEKVGDTEVDVLEGQQTEPGIPGSATIRIMFGKADHLLRAIIFAGKSKDRVSGNELTFKVESNYDLVNTSPTFTPADFRFSPPPDAKREPATAARPAK